MRERWTRLRRRLRRIPCKGKARYTFYPALLSFVSLIYLIKAILHFLYASMSRVSSMEVTKEFDPQNLLELFSIFAINLSSPTKDVQILTLRILSYFVKMDQRLITDEERPHKRQRTEVSGEEAVAKYANVCLVN